MLKQAASVVAYPPPPQQPSLLLDMIGALIDGVKIFHMRHVSSIFLGIVELPRPGTHTRTHARTESETWPFHGGGRAVI